MGGITEDGKVGKRQVMNRDKENEYALSLSGIFDELLECNLNTGEMEIIIHTQGKAMLSVNRRVRELREFAQCKVHAQDRGSFLDFFDLGHMRMLLEQGDTGSISFRQRIQGQGYSWIKAVAVPASKRGDRLLCYVMDLGPGDRENHLLKQIVDRFVFRNCDYLICIDMEKDSYALLCENGSPDPLHTEYCGYSGFIRTLVTQYAAPEDRDMLEKDIKARRVNLVLDREGEYVVTYGMEDAGKGYLRKRLQYMYYDKTRSLVLLMQTDITKEYTELRRQKERLTDALRHARMDSLTGIYNRQATATRISRLLAEHPGDCSALLFLDLDNFKMVNDTLGHRTGDLVLRQAADLFRQALRAPDVIGRVGGDEFVAFLPGISSPEEARECASRLCRSMQHIQALKGMEVKLSCSVGGALCPEDGGDYDSLLIRADAAVYEAKRRGKNQYAFFGPDVELTGGEHFQDSI